MGNQTTLYWYDLMRTMPSKASATIGTDGKLNARPPVKSFRVHRLDLTRPVEAGEPLELFTYDGSEKFALDGRVDVLKIASTTLAGVLARCLHSARGGLEDLDGVRAQERLGSLRDADPYAFAGQRVPHEHHLPFEPRNAVPTVRDRADVDDLAEV